MSKHIWQGGDKWYAYTTSFGGCQFSGDTAEEASQKLNTYMDKMARETLLKHPGTDKLLSAVLGGK